jgi:hypothetical protein
LETIYEFEIHYGEEIYGTSISAIDIVEAIYGVLDIYKYNAILGFDLTEDNIVLISE